MNLHGLLLWAGFGPTARNGDEEGVDCGRSAGSSETFCGDLAGIVDPGSSPGNLPKIMFFLEWDLF